MLPETNPQNNGNTTSNTASPLDRIQDNSPPAGAPKRGRSTLIGPERRMRKPRTSKPETAPAPAPTTPSTAPPATMTEAEKVMPIASLSRLRLAQNFGEHPLVEKVLTLVPVRKPGRNEFFRARSGEEWRFPTAMLVHRDELETEHYFVDPSLHEELVGNLRPVELVLAISKGGGIFLIPIGLPDENGKWNLWHRSLAETMEVAETYWVKLAADRSQNMYQAFKARGEIPDPIWPDLTMDQILELALKDRFISTPDHPILRQIRGEI